MQWADRTSFEEEEDKLTEALRHRAAGGKQTLDLTVSNPTRCGFTHDADALLTPLSASGNLQYAAEPFGPLQARQAIVERYYAPRNAVALPGRTLLTASTSEAYSYLFRLLCNAGDQVLVPQPGYPLFDLLAGLHDVELLHYPLHLHDGWSIDVHACERLITERTRALIVVHPNNPTGHFVSAADRELLYELALKHGLAIIADEVFLDYALAGTPTSFLNGEAPALTFVLSGLSKVLALPQMKVAWTVMHGPAAVCDEAVRRLEFIADTFLSGSLPAMNAVPGWFGLVPALQEQVRSRVRTNLATLDAAIAEGSLLSRLPVKGGWSALLRIPAVKADREVTLNLLERDGVLVHPGSFYGLPPHGYLVVSLIVPEPVFVEGIARVVNAVNKFANPESKSAN